MCASFRRHPDDPKQDQSIRGRHLRRLGIQRDALHRRRAPKRQRDFVTAGIARFDVRSLTVLLFMHDRLMVVVRGEAVLMFRVIVPDVGVRVQARHLATGGQQGDSHEDGERALHEPECMEALAPGQRRQGTS